MLRGTPEFHRAAARKGVERWRDDPVRFAHEVLGIERLTPHQLHFMRAVAAMGAQLEGRAPPKGSPNVGKKTKIAVRSGHRTGKSRTLAILAFWWALTRIQARVIITSSSRRQIKSVLWRDLRMLYDAARFPLGGVFNRDPETGVQFSGGREIQGFATDEPEKMAGFAGPSMLFLVDECSGVLDGILQAIDGNRAGGGIAVYTSNPTKTAGRFYEAFGAGQSETYYTIHISSEEVAEIDPPIRGLASKQWCEDQAREYGRDSVFYQVRVLGNFPSQAENAVIPLHLVESARQRWVDSGELDEPTPGTLALGLDVARFGGDESVVTWRRGLHLSRPVVWVNLDAPELAANALGVARGERRAGETPQVNVDVVGLGAAVVALLELADDIEVAAIHAQDPPTDERFRSMRDQLWWGMRDWLKGGGTLPDDPKLLAELVGPTYGFDPQGRIRIESKDEMKKRISRSPDRADSACLAVFQAGNLSAGAVVLDGTKMPQARFADVAREGSRGEPEWSRNRFESKPFDDEDDDD